MRRENIPTQDLLWNLKFYTEFIRDAVCHYCFGSLNETGGGLDRIVNGLGHTCYNVLPCCRRCNTIKGAEFSYEDMMLLAPILREIIKRKSSEQNDPSSGERVTPACRS